MHGAMLRNDWRLKMMMNISKYIYVYLILGISPINADDWDTFNAFEYYQMDFIWWADHLWYPNSLEHSPECPCGNYDKYRDED